MPQKGSAFEKPTHNKAHTAEMQAVMKRLTANAAEKRTGFVANNGAPVARRR